jgi:hypothetical protein
LPYGKPESYFFLIDTFTRAFSKACFFINVSPLVFSSRSVHLFSVQRNTSHWEVRWL